MALLCPCNIVAIGNLFFSLRTGKVLPVFLFLASGSAAVAVAMGAGGRGRRRRRAWNGHSTTSATRTRRRRDSLFVRDRHDEMEGREGGREEERKRQKAAAPEDVSWRRGGFGSLAVALRDL